MCRLPPLLPDSRHNLVVHCLMDYRLMAGGFAQAGETLDSWRTHHVASVRSVSRESEVCVHFGQLPLMFSSNYFFFAFYFVLVSDSDFFIIGKRQKNWPILRSANFFVLVGRFYWRIYSEK